MSLKSMPEKSYNKLLNHLKRFTSAAIAFSGGTDSTFLLFAAKEALENRILALTVKTPYIPDWEVEEASAFCSKYGIRHTIIQIPFPEIIRNNPEDRCYKCKRQLFERLLEEKAASGIEVLIEGTNADDITDYRPGLKALQELGIGSPLLEMGITKEEVRAFSKLMGLPTWDKPAFACLLTRLPYNRTIAENDLERIEKAELFLFQAGYKSIRVRAEGDTARIEMDKNLIRKFMSTCIYETVAEYLKSLGFRYVTLDLEGYRKGSFNSTIEKYAYESR
jgi:uncharacterized protein